MKRLISLVSALILTLVFASCAPNEQNEANSTSDVAERNSLTVNLISLNDSARIAAAREATEKKYQGLPIVSNSFLASGFDLYSERQYSPVNVDELQVHYDNIINNLRTEKAGDLIEGDSLYTVWTEAAPPDWYKLAQTGAFASIEGSATDDMAWIEKQNLSDSFYKDGKLCIVPLETDYLFFTTTEKLAAEWNFDFPKLSKNGSDYEKSDNILEFLEKCADWVYEYGGQENAPQIMPDYEYNRLKLLALDVCGIEIVDYQTGEVNFDNAEAKRILEALKTIGEDIEPSGFEETSVYDHEREACESERYLFCGGYIQSEDYLSMGLRDINDEYFCAYATRWFAIPASSKNKEHAYDFMKNMEIGETDTQMPMNSWYYDYQNRPEQYRGEKALNLSLPSGWSFALSDLFSEYYQGHIDVDEFARQVQGRLEVYITE